MHTATKAGESNHKTLAYHKDQKDSKSPPSDPRKILPQIMRLPNLSIESGYESNNS